MIQVGTFWESAFTLISLIQWIWLAIRKGRLKLTSLEKKLKQQFFADIEDSELKQLCTCSEFNELPVGIELTKQGNKIKKLHLITEGKVDIHFLGKYISSCKPGDLSGEISILTDSPASATAIATTQYKVIEFNHDQLASIIKSSSEIAASVNNIINKVLTDKLIKQNTLALS